MPGMMITPYQETLHLSRFQKARRRFVVLKKEDAHYMSGYGRDARYMLSKSQVEALCSAAEVRFTSSVDISPPDPKIYRWQAVAELDEAGKPRGLPKSYELDFRIVEEDGVDGGLIKALMQRRQEAMQKAFDNPDKHKKGMPALDAPEEDWQEWIRSDAMKELIAKQRFPVQLVETGAQLRAARTLLSIPSTVPADAFDEPWTIVRIEADVEAAMGTPGEIGDLAKRMVAASLSKQLGLSSESIDSFMAGYQPKEESKKIELPDDLGFAADEEIEMLVNTMLSSGWKDKKQIDTTTLDIFGLPLSQLSKRHVTLLGETIEITKLAASKLDKEELAEFRSDIRNMLPVCYASGTTVEEEISNVWANRIYAEEQKGDETEEAEKEDNEG